MSIIIGIDHGYYAIKTAHCSFPAGLTSYGEHEPYTRQGLLEFGGCFFVCGSGRQPIQRDKTVNDNYYLLTLAAIAKEILQRGLPPECSVRIAAGLPLTSFGRDKPKFKEYLLRSNQPVNFKFEGVEYSITIEEAVFPQGYAALMTEVGLLQDEPSMLLMDLGGWTVDLMRIDNAIPVADTAHSLELGMIRCVDDIREQVRRETGLSLTDAQIENMLAGQPCTVSEAVRDIVNAANRDKTESACFETGLGCTTTSAFEDMRLNTLRWHKETGVQGYHLVQSFAEGEVTPELAHQIGVEFAEQLLHGKYQAIVTTHLNTKHYHNHIVWSAVSLEDGKKYHSNSKSYYTEVRALSDSLCQKYGLSIIETPESLRGKRQYEKWRAEENNKSTWRTAIRQDVDEAIQQSLTWRQFLTVLERKGYEVRLGRKYPVLRPPGKERFVRFKTLGKRYTPEAIQTRILYPRSYRPYVENPPTIQHGRLRSGKPRRKLTGLRALYYRYLYELGALPRKPRRPSYAVRQDAYKLDQRIRQMEFLSKNNIDTLAQLETYRQAKLGEIVQLTAERKSLYKTNPDSPRIQQVNTALKQLRQEERLCRKIAEHSLEVQQHLTEARRDRAEQQQREQEHERARRPNIDLTL